MSTTKHTTIEQLKKLALRTKNEISLVDAKVAGLTTKVNDLVTAGGEPNKLEGIKVNGTLLALTDKIADILIAEGKTNGTISANGVDIPVHGLAALAYKSEVAESDLAAALKAIIDAKAKQADLDTLTGNGEGSISKMIDAAINKFATDVTDDNVVNSYKELIDWVAKHGPEATKMAGGISENKTATLTYNGSAQTPKWQNFDNENSSVNVSAKTNAGDYTATFTLKKGMWTDGTTAAKTIKWTIGRATIAAVPAQSGTLVYDGNPKTPSWNTAYDSAKMTVSVTAATNAGTYSATFTPTSNYKWSDGSTGGKTASWTIGKAANSVTNSPSSIVLKSSAKTATFTVNRKGNGTITATSNNTSVAKIKSINQNTGVVTVESVNDTTGTAKITVKVAEGTNYKAASDTTVNVTATFVTIYGVEWDWTSSGSTKGTRTDAAASFGDPSPAVNNGSGSSPFDNLMPWSGMVKETRSGGVEVKEPKYWFKWTKTGKKLKLQIADGPVAGFSVDPVNRDRGDGKGELDFSYIGRYHCASGYKSTTSAAQQVNITRSQARTGIHNLGNNFYQIDFAQFWYVNMLFLVEFADWNGERIGRGCSTSGSKMNNGQTDAMGYHTGTTAASRDSYGFTQYRNIEGWWDNVYDWMDGCYYNNNGLNVISNPNNFSDSANGTLVGTPSSGYPSDFTIPTASGLEWALFPSAANGSQTTYVPDGWYFYGRYPCLSRGGSYFQGQDRGPFYVDCSDASDTYGGIGCRLQERPPKAA